MSIDRDFFARQWDAGQQHLAGGRYGAARRELESAEAIAWRRRDAAALARLYLPLIEVRRLLRLQAAEGVLLVSADGKNGRGRMKTWLREAVGTAVIGGSAAERAAVATATGYAARRRECALEVLWLMRAGGETRVVSPVDGTFAGGVPVRPRAENSEAVDPTGAMAFAAGKELGFTAPLPGDGMYDPRDVEARPFHAMGRETLLVMWETLALRWQMRHPLRATGTSADATWREMAWLRRALRVDPACEPAALRLVALAEAVARMGAG
jgi:hypothetical protein